MSATDADESPGDFHPERVLLEEPEQIVGPLPRDQWDRREWFRLLGADYVAKRAALAAVQVQVQADAIHAMTGEKPTDDIDPDLVIEAANLTQEAIRLLDETQAARASFIDAIVKDEVVEDEI